jgi:hypothetical protein
MKTARRLDIIEEYYLLNWEVRQLALEETDYQYGIEAQTGHHNRYWCCEVIEDENAHQSPVIRDCQVQKKYGWFYLIIMITLNQYNFAFDGFSKEGICIFHWFKWRRWSLIQNPGYPTYTSVTNLAVPVYYDLKRVRLEPTWFWSFRKIRLTKVKIMWIGYPHMPTEQGKLGLFES